MNKYGIRQVLSLPQAFGVWQWDSYLARESKQPFWHSSVAVHERKICDTSPDGLKLMTVSECMAVAEQSFRDHSESVRARYSKLFKLDKDDYKGWAKGLKEAGAIAHNPRYPDL
ncbi:hypothetical protein FQA39_LY19409 [Lamprigera yunnana]|nr:hypothetical protein FQA39_LY19409 [Lamprigera yunnana]